MSVLLKEIAVRLETIMENIAKGDDLPPGQRFRLEGLLEAAVLTQVATEAELRQLLERVHAERFGVSVAERLWDGWEEAHPFPVLPLYVARAPVAPTTGD